MIVEQYMQRQANHYQNMRLSNQQLRRPPATPNLETKNADTNHTSQPPGSSCIFQENEEETSACMDQEQLNRQYKAFVSPIGGMQITEPRRAHDPHDMRDKPSCTEFE